MAAETSAPHMDEAEFAVHAMTFHHFMLGVKWAAIHLASVLVFLVVAFATSAGLLAGLVAGVVVYAVGLFVMNHGLAHSTEDNGPHPA